MSRKKKEYRRLPGSHKNFVGSRSTLWMGNDHLLSINRTFGTERYKRFYFKDIQTFVTRKTAQGKIQNIAMGAMTAFFGLIAYTIGAVEMAWVFGILSALMALILLVNLMLGPTCECQIQTAVQKENIKSLHRWRTAAKALNIIMPQIRQAQGGLSLQTLRAGWRNLPAEAKDSNRPSPTLPENRWQGRIHTALFGALLALGLAAAFRFYQQHLAIVLLEIIFGLGTAVLVIMALVGQHQSRITGGVRIMTWVSLGYMGAYLLCGYIVFMFLSFTHPAIMNDEWELLKILAQQQPAGHPLLFGINMFTTLGASLLGLGGLFFLRRSY